MYRSFREVETADHPIQRADDMLYNHNSKSVAKHRIPCREQNNIPACRPSSENYGWSCIPSAAYCLQSDSRGRGDAFAHSILDRKQSSSMRNNWHSESMPIYSAASERAITSVSLIRGRRYRLRKFDLGSIFCNVVKIFFATCANVVYDIYIIENQTNKRNLSSRFFIRLY